MASQSAANLEEKLDALAQRVADLEREIERMRTMLALAGGFSRPPPPPDDPAPSA
jgi:hypothetical protein